MNGYKNGGGGVDADGPSSGRSGGGGGGGGRCALPWRVGLLNARGRYLTAETFGFKINATGAALRKKQLWTIDYDADGALLVRSHLGRYLAGDARGNAACSAEEPADTERFALETHPDGSGRWALRNRATGLYFGGGSDERLVCHEKQPGNDEWWTPHFAFPPQVCRLQSRL